MSDQNDLSPEVVFETMASRFTSGNAIPVERAWVKEDEWLTIVDHVAALKVRIAELQERFEKACGEITRLRSVETANSRINRERLDAIKQSPRQATVTDVEDLCDEVERLRSVPPQPEIATRLAEAERLLEYAVGNEDWDADIVIKFLDGKASPPPNTDREDAERWRYAKAEMCHSFNGEHRTYYIRGDGRDEFEVVIDRRRATVEPTAPPGSGNTQHAMCPKCRGRGTNLTGENRPCEDCGGRGWPSPETGGSQS